MIARKTTPAIADNVTNFLTVSPFCERAEPYFNFSLIEEHPADNKFVDCAMAASVDHLVSKDRHFEVLRGIEFPKVDVLTLADFERMHRSESETSQ